jgi:glycosyl transferase family 7 (putative galactosyltransferase)
MVEVSVVLALFGSHRANETAAKVVESWLDQDVPCEVVLGLDQETNIDDLGVPRSHPSVRAVPALATPPTRGRLMNVAVRQSRGDVLYLTDADVIPLGRDYLRRALEALATPDGFLAQPRMLRLTGPVPEGPTSRWRAPQDDGQVCYVRHNGDNQLLHDASESTFVWFDGQLWVDPPPELVPPGSTPDKLRRPAIHWSAVLVRRQTFMSVAGYCSRYQGWGCEDEDLLDKLMARATVVRAWREVPQLLCVHLEHPPSVQPREYAANQAFLKERRRAGVEAMIKQDRDAGWG